MQCKAAPVFILGLASFLMAEEINPPVAPRIAHQETRHASTVTDNYFWLREKSNPEVVKYLEAENAYTAAMTKDLLPFQDSLYKEMLGRIKQTDLSVPSRQPAISTIREPRKASNTQSSAAAKAAWMPGKRFCSIRTRWPRD